MKHVLEYKGLTANGLYEVWEDQNGTFTLYRLANV